MVTVYLARHSSECFLPDHINAMLIFMCGAKFIVQAQGSKLRSLMSISRQINSDRSVILPELSLNL